ncbi:unnamed protein product [[Actinomadura] parvosata subsp. kistnae]|uniref:DUF2752 domain-containing protein n=1 Tax=[Actinomadura] parvosata subsp. kistnae TaxID=1909395 RepID=A0A1V0A3K2_9ACTN|nr:DUF2752 domain-containing protein [Nonomuraea sp. ATCC 55076]AQZ64768.1 hypothetical protein BKM31_27870 [Nonomuraea sp. ATCC 55076]SPL98479.1 unnamed protein product [Actinomadura parvosata subsp. kistnae]
MTFAATEQSGKRRLKALLPPLGVAALTGAVFTVVGMVDPNEPGHYPTCPFLWLTGLYCPGCGTLRTIHALAHLDPVAALGLNPLAVAMIPFLVFWWGRWVVRALQGRPRRTTLAHPAWLWAFLAIVMVYWVVRNLPFGAFLAP